MAIDEKIQLSRDAGYSDEEIVSFLSEKDPEMKTKFESSFQQGYKPSEVLDHISKQPPQGLMESLGRKAGIFGKARALFTPIGLGLEAAGQLGALEGTEGRQIQNWRETALDAIEQLTIQKDYGEWNPQKEEQLSQFYDLLNKSDEEIAEMGGIQEMPSFAPSALSKKAEKAVGIDLTPKGFWEKAIDFIGSGFRGKVGEKGAKKAGEILTEKTPEIVKKEIERAVASAPIASAAAGVEEGLGIPAEYYLLGHGAASAAKEIGKFAVSKVGQKYFLFDPTNLRIKDLRNSFKEEAARGLDYAQDQLERNLMSAKTFEEMKPYFDQAIELGIPLTPSAVTNSKYFKNMEKIIKDSPVSQENVEKLRQEAAKAWADSVEKVMEKSGRKSYFSSPEAVVDSLKTDVVVAKEKQLTDQYTKLYDESKKSIKNEKAIDAQYVDRLENAFNEVIETRVESLLPTSAETATLELAQKAKRKLYQTPSEAGKAELEAIKLPTGEKVAQIEKEAAAKEYASKKGATARTRAQAKVKGADQRQKQTLLKSEKQLKNIFGKEADLMKLENGRIKFKKPPTPSEIISTIQSLNKTIEWDNPSIKNLLAKPLNEFKSILGETLGKSNPEAYKKYIDANNIFKEKVGLFGENSKWKKWGIKSDTSTEDLLKTLNTPEKFRSFAKDFGNTERGKLLIDELKNQKVKEILVSKFDKVKYEPGAISRELQKLKNNKYFRTITPPEVWNNLEGLQRLDALLERRSRDILTRAPSEAKIDTVVGATKSLISLITLTKLATNVSKTRRAEIFSEIFTDPSFSKKMNEIGQKVLNETKKKNPNPEVVQYALSEAKILLDSIKESSNPKITAAAKSAVT